MAIKKKVNGTWQPITPKQLKGLPYTGTLPAVIAGTKAGYLHRYKIYGNTEQASGTPTPENPIVPSECGERTANLFDSQDVAIGKYIASDGTEGTSSGSGDMTLNHSAMVSISPSTSYTFYINKSTATDALTNAFCWFDENKTIITRDLFDVRSWETEITKTYQAPSNAAFLIINFRGATDKFASGMIVEGSTVPVNYIPFGYKLPLTSAGQNVDIYLGESQTTRRIKKLVLTGEENWSITSNNRLRIGLSEQLRPFAPICSHYTGSAATAWGDLLDKSITVSIAGYLAIYDTTYDNTTDFKAYLAQQYANGTPVTVWYVLATEETGTLNEPLRKIGDYADTIDSTQTSAQIPTAANSTTISWAGSGLAPSQFDSIQEWVDIPTYKRVNGAWVADN